jgi:hypothetical protein
MDMCSTGEQIDSKTQTFAPLADSSSSQGYGTARSLLAKAVDGTLDLVIYGQLASGNSQINSEMVPGYNDTVNAGLNGTRVAKCFFANQISEVARQFAQTMASCLKTP